eukprot:scaffold24945_cov23-Prasinocladus_malaysianus.AAC.1
MEVCLQHIQQHVPIGASVAEFHAGVGCIGLSLAAARGCRAVRGIEVNPTALEPYLLARQRLLSQLKTRQKRSAGCSGGVNITCS